MGMWDETCAITNFPIFPNDPCVVVVFEPGAVDGESRSFGFDASRHVRAVCKGTYNAYGWIDEAPEDAFDQDADVLVFVHRDVWEEVVAHWGGHVRPRGDDLPKPAGPVTAEDLREVQVVLDFAGTTRRDPLVGCLFRGVQDHRTLEAYELI